MWFKTQGISFSDSGVGALVGAPPIRYPEFMSWKLTEGRRSSFCRLEYRCAGPSARNRL
jgi:hypothetical protein